MPLLAPPHPYTPPHLSLPLLTPPGPYTPLHFSLLILAPPCPSSPLHPSMPLLGARGKKSGHTIWDLGFVVPGVREGVAQRHWEMAFL
ncbi:PREDICTED: putative uncharacterized protein DDB_G0276327 [Galeopterus variegatus]|uniref:Uncharacterized protein n=1 Tax=Galeopterus variegatus TaxID=482537 RepID=A0ABM0R1Q0_GALVR|nr:PREDICTED: putative uncharacterized protein DDB_G0276327 [Galeopterus variegatus]